MDTSYPYYYRILYWTYYWNSWHHFTRAGRSYSYYWKYWLVSYISPLWFKHLCFKQS